MTLCATVFFHLLFELAFVKILVARLTPKIGEDKDLCPTSLLLVTIVARSRNMCAGECEFT